MSCNSYSSYSLYNSNKNVNQQICCLKEQIQDLSNIVYDLSQTILSKEQLTIISNDISYVVALEPNYTIIPLTTTIVNQNNFVINSNQLTFTQENATKYFEITSNLDIVLSASNSRTFKLDISGVNNSFIRTLDIRSISRTGTNNISFGPIFIYPSEINFNDTFVFRVNINGNHDNVIKNIITLKSFNP